jgi:hypothetical protein
LDLTIQGIPKVEDVIVTSGDEEGATLRMEAESVDNSAMLDEGTDLVVRSAVVHLSLLRVPQFDCAAGV